MILFGASGHAKVILDVLNKQGVEVPYLLDDNKAVKELLNLQVRTYSPELDLTTEELIVSIGVNRIRKKVVEKLDTNFGTAIHPDAVLDPNVTIDKGTVVMGGAVINSSSQIGHHTIINTRASVDHDCRIGDYCHISPGAILCGDVSVGEGTQVGAGAIVIQGVKIGKWVTVGAGAIVIQNIPDNAVVVGNPARIIKYND